MQNREMSSDEVSKAQGAAPSETNNMSGSTIFTKILNKEIPASIVHEDDQVRLQLKTPTRTAYELTVLLLNKTPPGRTFIPL